MELATIGLDLAKHVFQVHGVDEAGHVVVKRRLRRVQVVSYFASLPPCLVGMEACATARHVLLSAVTIADDRLQTSTIRGQDQRADQMSHATSMSQLFALVNPMIASVH